MPTIQWLRGLHYAKKLSRNKLLSERQRANQQVQSIKSKYHASLCAYAGYNKALCRLLLAILDKEHLQTYQRRRHQSVINRASYAIEELYRCGERMGVPDESITHLLTLISDLTRTPAIDEPMLRKLLEPSWHANGDAPSLPTKHQQTSRGTLRNMLS